MSAAVGLGHLALWPVLAAATLGAIAGDGLSFWIGNRWRDGILTVWPLRSHPDLIARSNSFFARHGGKSILIARFTPGVRAIVPVMAGVSGMSPARFFTANVVSALIWAPAHILPGAAAGFGVGLAGHASLRLVVLAAVLLGAVVAVVMLTRLLLRRVVPVLAAQRHRIVGRLREDPGSRASVLALSVLAPSDDLRPLIVLGVPLTIVAATMATLAQEVAERSGLAAADRSISLALGHLRTEPGDRLVAFITGFGDAPVIIAATAAAVVWLLWRRQLHLAIGVAVTVMISSGLATLLKGAMAIPRPTALYDGVQVYGFPSGHATGAATLMGLLVWFAWTGLGAPWRRAIPLALAGIVGAIVASRLYLSAHWPSDVAGGLLLGIGLTLCFALAFRRADVQAARPGVTVSLSLAVFLAFGAWHSARSLPQALALYAPLPVPVQTLSRVDWQTTGWATLPARRIDLGGEAEEAIVLQWAGPISGFETAAGAAGWVRATDFSLGVLTRYLDPTVPDSQLPVLPRLQDGQLPVLTMIRVAPDGQSRDVLRLWRSAMQVAGPDTANPVLLGGAETEIIRRTGKILVFPSAQDVSSPAVPDLGLSGLRRRRSDGQTVILAPPA
ncbi:bifunctional DedA family/phosphatase PAP2 family protein [Paracoccus subflavus]|uniref:bifunctional DedA family/phosphatase PAP2 family protein n=1 Tax=Paracoccus subflavus TaxID=2528244 RepID=UPI0013EF0817|nr:bifunctional DedA family/phosphatase PAP2 family protein [Paracoccus subflavus]